VLLLRFGVRKRKVIERDELRSVRLLIPGYNGKEPVLTGVVVTHN